MKMILKEVGKYVYGTFIAGIGVAGIITGVNNIKEATKYIK